MRAFVLFALVACGGDRKNDPTPTTTTPTTTTPTGTTTLPTDPDLVFQPEVLLPIEVDERVHVTNVRQAPLRWGPGLELVLTEVNPPSITWVGCNGGACASESLPLGAGMNPARTATADLDADGDEDLIVASIGSLGPTNYLVGSVWVYWRDGDSFTPTAILDPTPRMVCAEPGDLDGDGDLDIITCGFGHRTVGEVGWLEQDGADWNYHLIDERPGAIHAFPTDIDGDGDQDILVGMAQLTEQLLLYRNDGTGAFDIEVVFERADMWFGLSGIELVDLDLDGDMDVLLSNGDTMDNDLPDGVDPNSAHALRWFENDGTGAFTEHLIHMGWGCYTIRADDLDLDGDIDVVLGNFQNTGHLAEWVQPSELWVFKNDGSQNFTAFPVPGAPEQLITIEIGDADQDGDVDIFASSLAVDATQGNDRLVLLENLLGE